MQTTRQLDSTTPLVLANSLASNHLIWQYLTPHWETERPIIQVEYAGHTQQQSNHPTLTLAMHNSVQAMGDDIIQQLDARGIHTFDFAGVSLGAMVGLDLASRYPDRVGRLLAANCRSWQEQESREQWDARIELVQKEGIQAICEGTLSRWFTPAFTAAHPTTVEQIRTAMLAVSPSAYRAAAQAVRDQDLRHTIAQIRCPVLLVTGNEDLAAPAEHMQEVKKLLSHAQLEVLADCAHISSLEQAGRLRTLSQTFFS